MLVLRSNKFINFHGFAQCITLNGSYFFDCKSSKSNSMRTILTGNRSYLNLRSKQNDSFQSTVQCNKQQCFSSWKRSLFVGEVLFSTAVLEPPRHTSLLTFVAFHQNANNSPCIWGEKNQTIRTLSLSVSASSRPLRIYKFWIYCTI